MNIVKPLLLVGLGGGIGSICRYLTALLVNRYWKSPFPMATFAINMLGCFIIGILAGIAFKYSWANDNFKLLFVTGFCGGYTTFSTFAFENVSLLQNNNSLVAFLYIGTSIFTGLLAAWLGIYLTK